MEGKNVTLASYFGYAAERLVYCLSVSQPMNKPMRLANKTLCLGLRTVRLGMPWSIVNADGVHL